MTAITAAQAATTRTSPKRRRPSRPAAWPHNLDVGMAVTATTTAGAFSGRIFSLTPGLMRLKWGAGLWDVHRGDLIAVTVTDRQPATPTPLTRQQERAQASRIMSRWP